MIVWHGICSLLGNQPGLVLPLLESPSGLATLNWPWFKQLIWVIKKHWVSSKLLNSGAWWGLRMFPGGGMVNLLSVFCPTGLRPGCLQHFSHRGIGQSIGCGQVKRGQDPTSGLGSSGACDSYTSRIRSGVLGNMKTQSPQSYSFTGRLKWKDIFIWKPAWLYISL